MACSTNRGLHVVLQEVHPSLNGVGDVGTYDPVELTTALVVCLLSLSIGDPHTTNVGLIFDGVH